MHCRNLNQLLFENEYEDMFRAPNNFNQLDIFNNIARFMKGKRNMLLSTLILNARCSASQAYPQQICIKYCLSLSCVGFLWTANNVNSALNNLNQMIIASRCGLMGHLDTILTLHMNYLIRFFLLNVNWKKLAYIP